MTKLPDVDDSVLEEGCYHLSKIGLTDAQIASRFEISAGEVRVLAERYEGRLKSLAQESTELDRAFWEDVKKEAEGDVKVTFVSAKGFHHAWKSELRRLDGQALMSVFEASKDFLGSDPNQRFLDFPPPRGYDPLALDREISRAVAVIGDLLREKWEHQKVKTGKPADAPKGSGRRSDRLKLKKG